MTPLNALRKLNEHPQKVAVIIPAHNIGRVIASTVRSCRAIPGVDLIIVIDDGSSDNTAKSARHAGAVVVSHSVERGRASAIETGVKVAAMRDMSDGPARHILVLSGDLGESAVDSTMLVEAVMLGQADMAVATPVDQQGEPGQRFAERVARASIRRATGWDPRSPLKMERCLTREAVTAAMPFSPGAGLEVSLTIDILASGLSVVELPCSFIHHDADGAERGSRRSRNPLEIMWAAARKMFSGSSLPLKEQQSLKDQAVGTPYPMPAYERVEETSAE